MIPVRVLGTITLNNCAIAGNTTDGGGGGVYNANFSGVITLLNCAITSNAADEYSSGGGVYNYSPNGTGTGAITLTNCTIADNSAPDSSGGGVFNDIFNYNSDSSTIALTNCSVSGNMAQSGSGIYNYSDNNTSIGTISLTNDIVYGDAGDEVANYTSTDASLPTFNAVAADCDIQGGYSGSGNIAADPRFINAAGGDLHLNPASPCIGAGTAAGAPPADKDGTPRATPPTLGAYEGAEFNAGTTHLLWKHISGECSVWTVNPNGSFTSTPGYGPIPGWTVAALADGSDGKPRLLWVN